MLLHRTVVAVLTFLLALNVVCKLAGYVWLSYAVPNVASDVFPWTMNRNEVSLQFDTWARYKLHSAHEWAALVPGDGLVHIGADQEPYTVSMLHQLRCIDFVREQLTQPKPARNQTRHCMNYLRQMLMCRADDMLDSYQYVHKIRALDAQPVRQCHDWRAVYEWVERNQVEHSLWTRAGQNGTGRT